VLYVPVQLEKYVFVGDPPNRMYKLVYADGSTVERVDKHPFCMSRVFYSSKEKGQDVWIQPMDNSCRWKQSASEVSVQVLNVPQCANKREDLEVTLATNFIRVSSRGVTYLEVRWLV